MKKIIEVKVENFKCEYCGHTEYFVVDPYSINRKIHCDHCGMECGCEYEVKNEPWWNKIINFFFKCKG